MTPLAGKLGRLQVVASSGTAQHEFEDWTLDLDADMIEVNGFEKTPSDNNYWNSYLAGLCSGQAHFGGIWNAAITPTNTFRQGSALTYTSLYCGLTTAIGFTLYGKCKSITASTQVKQAGKFKGVFYVEGVGTYPS